MSVTDSPGPRSPRRNGTVHVATLVLALGAALGLALSLATARSAPAQEGSSPDSSTYVRTCDGGKILLKNSEFEMLKLHNQTRRERGKGYLCVNPDLTKSSRVHARDMMRNDYFKHRSQNGDSPIQRMEAAGYSNWTTWGENLSWGSYSKVDPASQFKLLMDSDGHRKNILKRSFREVGIGNAAGTFRGNRNAVVYTMNFGARRGQDRQYPREVSSGGPGSENPGSGDPRSTDGSTPGLYRDGVFYLKNDVSGGGADKRVNFGGDRRGTEPLMGDWDGDGKETVGIRRGNTFYLKNENTGGSADVRFGYGSARDEPVVGDWDGDGKETVGIRRGNAFYLKNSNTGGRADEKFRYGKSSDEPVVGDWDGSGEDTAGVVRGNRWLLSESTGGGEADIKFRYGRSSDEPVVGDWDANGTDTAGVIGGYRWFLTNSVAGGKVDDRFAFGKASDEPVIR